MTWDQLGEMGDRLNALNEATFDLVPIAENMPEPDTAAVNASCVLDVLYGQILNARRMERADVLRELADHVMEWVMGQETTTGVRLADLPPDPRTN